jgi:hypothetical protein
MILAGSALVADGMFWFSRLTEHVGYADQDGGLVLPAEVLDAEFRR